MQKGTKLIKERVVAICEEEWFRGVGYERNEIHYESEIAMKTFHRP